jgi:hypothetical protein
LHKLERIDTPLNLIIPDLDCGTETEEKYVERNTEHFNKVLLKILNDKVQNKLEVMSMAEYRGIPEIRSLKHFEWLVLYQVKYGNLVKL